MLQEDWLADSFNVFLDYSLQLIRKYRQLFPPYHHVSMNRLEYILRYGRIDVVILVVGRRYVYIRLHPDVEIGV